MVAASDIVAAVNENDRTENEEKLMQISGFHKSPILLAKFIE